MNRHAFVRLWGWTFAGCVGAAGVIYGGLMDEWTIYVPGLVVALASQAMLATGAFLRWPRRVRLSTRARV